MNTNENHEEKPHFIPTAEVDGVTVKSDEKPSLLDILIQKKSLQQATYKFNEGRLEGQRFKVSKMTYDQYYAYQNAARSAVDRKQHTVVEEKKFILNIVRNHCIEPNFNSVDVMAKLGVDTPEDGITEFFDFGEVQAIAMTILDFSGIGISASSADDPIGNIKNS